MNLRTVCVCLVLHGFLYSVISILSHWCCLIVEDEIPPTPPKEKMLKKVTSASPILQGGAANVKPVIHFYRVEPSFNNLGLGQIHLLMNTFNDFNKVVISLFLYFHCVFYISIFYIAKQFLYCNNCFFLKFFNFLWLSSFHVSCSFFSFLSCSFQTFEFSPPVNIPMRKRTSNKENMSIPRQCLPQPRCSSPVLDDFVVVSDEELTLSGNEEDFFNSGDEKLCIMELISMLNRK